eukprot:4172078-Prymnesium_polylepis.1
MVHNDYGVQLALLGDESGATAAYRSGLAVAPHSAVLLNSLSNQLSERDKTRPQAARLLRRALAADPAAHFAAYNLARLLSPAEVHRVHAPAACRRDCSERVRLACARSHGPQTGASRPCR